MDSLIDILVSYCNSSVKKDIYFDISYYIVTHYNNFFSITIKDIVKNCHTSISTVNKYCESLGFLNFHDFKKHFIAQQIMKKGLVLERYNNIKKQDLYNIYKTASHNHCLNEEKLYNKIDSIIDLIHHSNKVVLYGALFPQFLTFNFQVSMLTLGCPVINFTVDNFNNTKKSINDFLVVISYTGTYVFGDLERFNKVLKKYKNSLLISQYSSLMNQYIDNFNCSFFLPEKKEALEYNYILLAFFDLILYSYIEKYHMKKEDI